MTEKRFHPFAVLHLLRKTILVYLLPLVQVLFARNWAALWAALAQDVLLLALLSMVCWEVLRVSGWQMDAHGNLLVRWRLGIRLDRTLRADMLAALTIDRPVVYRLAGASLLTLYPAGQKKPLTLIVARDDARELADRLLPLEQPVVHRPHGGEKMVFAVLGANGLSTLALLALALRQSRPYAPDAQTLAFAHLSHLAAFAARWLPMGTAWMLVATGWLFCISLARSAAQVAHYTVWRTAAQLGSRGGLLHRYEMRLCRAHLNYADLRRSPVTRALHYCPVFVTAGSCAPELPLFVWKEGTPLLQELLPGVALPPDTAPDITRRSKIYFLPAGLPLGLCLLLTALPLTALAADDDWVTLNVEMYDRSIAGFNVEDCWQLRYIQENFGDPNHIKINWIPVSRWEEGTILSTRLAGGTAPDICMTYGTDLVQQYIDMGGIMPLDDLLAEYGQELTAFLGDEVLQYGQYDVGDGKEQYYLPARRIVVATQSMFIRKDWLEKLDGETYPDPLPKDVKPEIW